MTDQKKRILREVFFTEQGRLRHPDNQGFGQPLVISQARWDEVCSQIDVVHGDVIRTHDLFTLFFQQEYVERWKGLRGKITIACPQARPSRVVFGPYRQAGREKMNALNFLVDAGAVVLANDVKEQNYEVVE